jgi:CBS domain-containing protein
LVSIISFKIDPGHPVGCLLVATLVEEAMTREVVSVSPDANVEEAARIMARLGISSLVVSRGDELLGIITERDVTTRVVAAGALPGEVRIGDVMSKSLLTVPPDAPLEDATRVMLENRIKKLPVVDESRRLLGILSITDSARHRAAEAEETPNDAFWREILTRPEGQQLELKSTLRWDLQRCCVNPDLEQVVAKTVAAFLNAEGGDLVIGLSDDRVVVGLEKDYETLKNRSRDGFENRLTTLLGSALGSSFLKLVSVSFSEIGGRDLCRVHVAAATEPAFLKDGDRESFFVRAGNSSRPFGLRDATRYIRERWR